MAHRTCSIEDCTRAHQARGLCNIHYLRQLRLGSLDLPVRPEFCSVDGCETRALARGWCRVHYNRWRKHGDPTIVLKSPGPVHQESAGYYAAHYRIYAVKGKARQYACPCGKPATQWAYDHSDPNELSDQETGYPYSLDTSRYTALCRSCHSLLDHAHRRNETA